MIGRKNSEKLEEILQAAKQNADNIYAMQEKLSEMAEKIETISKEHDEISNRLSALEKIAEDAEKNGTEILNKSADDINKKLVDFASLSNKTLKGIKKAITDNSKAMTETSETLTQFYAEMISEHNRQVNESISLLLADSIVSKIPCETAQPKSRRNKQ